MATFYWVGGSGTWDTTTTTNWAATSGGAGGAGVPTAADTAIFDTLSGAAGSVITISSSAVCLDWTCSNTNSFTYEVYYNANITVYGSITWASGTNIAQSVGTIYCAAATGARTLNFAGKTVDINLQIIPSATAASYTLASAANFGNIVVAGTFNTSASNFAMTATSSPGWNGGTILFNTGYVGITGIATVTLNASTITGQNGVEFSAQGTYALNIAFGTSIITTTNPTTNISFYSVYTGANSYSINATSAAGHALRPNGDLTFDDAGSVKYTLALQQAGNTVGNTLQNIYVYAGNVGSTVTFAGTTNTTALIRTATGSTAITFTGAVIVGTDVSIEAGSATFSSTLNVAGTYSAYVNTTIVGAFTGTTIILYSGTTSFAAVNCSVVNIIDGTSSFAAVTCTDSFYYSASGNLTVTGAMSITNNISLTGVGLVTLSGGITAATTFSRSNGSLTLAAVTYTIRSSWYMQAGYTLTRSTSTIALSGLDLTSTAIDTTFDSGGYTYQNVSITGNLQTIQDTTGGSTALACAGTFTGTTLTNTLGVLNLTIGLSVTGALSLTGNSLVNRYLVRSNVYNTARSITRGSNTLTNVDFSDITFTGTAASGTSIGNCQGNANITFTTAVTRFARASGDWSSTAVWSATSGGATGATAPLAQDTVVFNAASGSITVNTADRRALGNSLFMNGFTGTINVNNSLARGSFLYGNIQIPTTSTLTGTDALILAGRGAVQNIDIRNTPDVAKILIYACGGSYTLGNNFSSTSNLYVNAGTFETLDKALTCASLNAWYTPYSTFMAPSSPNPSPITINLGTSTVAISGDIYNEWPNYPDTPASLVTINATGATISVNNIQLFYATFNTGTSNISFTGNIGLGYPAANPSIFTGNANLVFGPTSSFISAYGGANITCNSITTASNFNVSGSNVYVNNITSGGNLYLGYLSASVNLYVANNISTTVPKCVIAPVGSPIVNSALYLSGTITSLQDRAILLSSGTSTNKLTLAYSGPAAALETNNFLYFFNVNVTSGSIRAPAVADLGFNTGITFTGTARRLGFSAYSGAITLPSDVTPGAVMFTWGGGGGAGKRSTTGNVASSTGGGSGAFAIDYNAPITAGGTIYVNAAAATSKQTANANGATGGSSWVNLISNTAPVNNTQGVLAVGGGGSSITSGAGGAGGSSGSCIADYAISGLSGGAFRFNSSSNNYIGGTGGASFLFVGGSITLSTDPTSTNNNRGGVGGGGVSGAGTNYTSLSPNGTAGGLNQSSVAAAGGTGGDPPTAGASGTLGGGGAGGGGQVAPTSLSASFSKLVYLASTATITYPNHGFVNGNNALFTLVPVSGTYTTAGVITGATWSRPTSSTTVTVTTPSAHGLTTGDRRYLDFALVTGQPADGIYTLTVTGANTFTLTSNTGTPTTGSVTIGGLSTVTTTTPHGLVTGNTPSLSFQGLTVLEAVTVTNSTVFTVPRISTSSAGGSTTLGSPITTPDRQVPITNVTTNTFDISSIFVSNQIIYALASCTFRNPTGFGGNGGDGVAFANHYPLDYYNNVFYPAKYPIGLGGGGGGAGGVYTSFGCIVSGTGGSGGDGGIAAGGGGMGYGTQTGTIAGMSTASTFAAGNGGAGGPGLIIIQYQVAQGSSQAGFVG